MNTKIKILSTTNDIAPFFARMALGVVMFPHGAQKALGWFGGYGYGGTMGYLTETLGIPAAFAFLAIVVELVAPIALIAGALSRLAALGIGAIMAVAIFTVHADHGFFMNWSGSQGGEGYEYHLLAIGLALVTVAAGGGRWSVDSAWADRLAAVER